MNPSKKTKDHMKRFLLLACISLLLAPAFAQPAIIQLENPSFEDQPGMWQVPKGWTPCGFPEETPPDTHPGKAFGVKMPANDGKTYLGLVVRDNDTWEGVSQALKQPFQTGQCYGFTFFAACSKNYQSVSRMTSQPSNFKSPVKLRIWAGNALCERLQLLAETTAVDNHEWRSYAVVLKPNAPYTHLFLEAYYLDSRKTPYDGNILLDNLSDLSTMDCPDSILEEKRK